MKIYLEEENYQKEMYDLFSIFLEEEEFSFENDGDIEIFSKEKLLNFKGKRKGFKNKQELKKILYKNLVKYTGEKSPWGLLTGVRPVKLFRMLSEKYGIEKAPDILKEDYFLSTDKIRDLSKIYELEEELFSKKKDDIHLYFHLPFCDTRCDYCSYPTMITEKNTKNLENYLERLKEEIKELSPHFPKENIASLYIGGGTPTSLGEKELGDLLEVIRENFPKKVEFTVEAGREDSLTLEKLQILKNFGVTRICLNPQTFNEKSLKEIGRPFKRDEFFKRVEEIKKLDFPVLNMDFILGLPKENENSFRKNLEILSEIQPENITFHTLSLKRGSVLYDEAENVKEETKKFWKLVKEFVEEEGYNPYYLYRQKKILGNFQNIGYSRSKKECFYNMAMTDELSTILAFGQGTNSKFIGKNFHEQVFSPKNIRDYLLREDFIDEKKKNLRRLYG